MPQSTVRAVHREADDAVRRFGRLSAASATTHVFLFEKSSGSGDLAGRVALDPSQAHQRACRVGIPVPMSLSRESKE